MISSLDLLRLIETVIMYNFCDSIRILSFGRVSIVRHVQQGGTAGKWPFFSAKEKTNNYFLIASSSSPFSEWLRSCCYNSRMVYCWRTSFWSGDDQDRQTDTLDSQNGRHCSQSDGRKEGIWKGNVACIIHSVRLSRMSPKYEGAFFLPISFSRWIYILKGKNTVPFRSSAFHWSEWQQSVP